MNLLTDGPGPAAERRGDPSNERALHAVITSLDALHDFITNLTDEQYAAAPPSGASSVGCHARHCLDHVEALVRGVDEGLVDYDDRQRGTEVERSRSAALCRLHELRGSIERVAPVKERYLCVRSMVTPEGDAVRAHSSWSREILFVLSHTIHHQAMMAAAAQALGASVSPRFGCAPSTLAFRDRTPCAQSA